MILSSENISRTLRDARLVKGWSQRDLSERAGLPQAHISRLESGAVDPRLSTMKELARLLDLEIMLVPRPAVTAVQAVIRDVEAGQEARTARGAAHTLTRLVRHLRLTHPKSEVVERLAALARELNMLEPALKGPGALAELLKLTEAAEAIEARGADDDVELVRFAQRVSDYRNRLMHMKTETERPAYSLDDED